MAPVRSHKKSRLGCRTCRKRKVKCDETGFPNCNNCTKRAIKCDWPVEAAHGDDSRSLSEPISTVIQQNSGLSSDPEKSLAPHSFDIVTLELFHHCCTGMTLSLLYGHIGTNLTEMKRAYQHTLPRLALSHPFLMHSILSVSALSLHKACNYQVGQLDYHSLSKYHYRRGESHSAQFCKDGQCISTNHSCTQLATAQFVSDNLLSFVAFFEASSQIFGKRRGFQIDAVVDWMQSQRGRLGNFYDSHRQKLFNGPMSGELRFSIDTVSEIFANNQFPHNACGNIPMFPTLLSSIHVADVDSADDHELSEPNVTETYRNAIAILEVIHRVFAHGLPMHGLYTWSTVISYEFLEYVRERQPRALVIFATFCAFFQASLAGSTNLWWVERHHDWAKITRSLLSPEWQAYLDVCLNWGGMATTSAAAGIQGTGTNWAARIAGNAL
ncbi:hypothetical protein DL96DRAFT_1819641 [Flagelloscypha sp. PMI_526]|nr:hypothetical protein DL96DRAFT_1819641 [Flagelloscypha sp. PMI_526]